MHSHGSGDARRLILPGQQLALPGDAPRQRQRAEAQAKAWVRQITAEVELLRKVLAAAVYQHGGTVRLTAEEMSPAEPLSVTVAPHADGGLVVEAKRAKADATSGGANPCA